tara:strand:- start:175 stop:411 length:237 start_codon:yes stop_codon:yes gene_type:complete
METPRSDADLQLRVELARIENERLRIQHAEDERKRTWVREMILLLLGLLGLGGTMGGVGAAWNAARSQAAEVVESVGE